MIFYVLSRLQWTKMKRQQQQNIKNVYKYLVPDSTLFGCTICNQGNQDGN